MQIQSQHGIVSSIMMEPFSGTPESFGFRDHLLISATTQTGIQPSQRIDVFDEALLTFESLEQALDFLSEVIRLATTEPLMPNQCVELRCGLCWGEYFIHSDQFYGPAVNIATQLSFQSRKNEILIGGMNCEVIKQYLSTRSQLEYFIRDENEHLVSIALSGTDSTITRMKLLQLTIKSESFRQSYTPQRLLTLAVGRSPACNIHIEQDHVSRHHATLTLKDDQLFLEDHSANGTFVYTEEQEFFLSRESVKLGQKGELSFGAKAEDYPSLIISFRFHGPGEETGEYEICGYTASP